MRILVVGGGAREHALCWSLAKSSEAGEIYCAPGNPGIAEVADCLPVSSGETVEIAEFAEKLHIDLTIVGPEVPLSLGIADEFAKRELPIFGPTRLAAQIESSKVFAKEFFARHGIPTARAEVCSTAEEARAAIARFGYPAVLKADGLAGGKGVLTLESAEDSEKALSLFFGERVFGAAGDRVLVEEFLSGHEASFLAICDGEYAVPLPTARDYKKVYDGDRGPNTGGMGGYSPAGVLDAEGSSRVLRDIIWPTLRGLAEEGRPFRGVLYAGLMVTDLGPKVLEFNARFGDPETEVILPRVVSDMARVLRAATSLGELEQFSPLEVKNEVCAGVVLCAAGYPGVTVRGKVITGLTDAARVPGVELFQAHTQQDGDRLLTAGGRVMVATAMGPTLAEATARAYEAADRIQFEGKTYRRDIGAGGLKPNRV
jgi:phosphoribosylamine--glycine ligase